MAGETDLNKLLKTMRPKLNVGDFVFCTIGDLSVLDIDLTVLVFKEEEGYTIVLEKQHADNLHLTYSFVASWITLTVHSSLDAVGLTSVFSKALAQEGISCNVVAGYYHDHIFVNKNDAEKTMAALNGLSN